MKIFCIIQCTNLGGMEQVTLESLSLLKNEGHDVVMFSLHPVGDLKQLAEDKGIRVFGTKKYRWAGVGNVVEVLKAIRKHHPDRIWVVGHNFGSLLAGRLARLPVVLSIHYHHSERPRSFWRTFYFVAQRWCSRIHFVSHYIHDEVAGMIRKRDQVLCFPNMVRAPGYMPNKVQAREKLEIPDDAFVVGNAGWLIPRKAFDVFVETAALIQRSIPNVVFVIAGDGPERDNLETLAERLGIRQMTRFLGWQKDLSMFYGSLDVLLFNSHFDCLPTTPLEAMARGVPVVCSLANGGLKEVLRHGQDGYLIDRHDPQALAAEVCRLYHDRASAAEIAQAGRIRIEETCSMERHLENLNAYLELS